MVRIASPPSRMIVCAARQLITDHSGDVGKAHLDQRMPECAEVSAEPLVLLTANHDDIMVAVAGMHKLEQPASIPLAPAVESPQHRRRSSRPCRRTLLSGAVEYTHSGHL